MAIATETAPAPVDWRKLHAFGWPSGSVRAMLALLVCATIWALLLVKPEMEVPDYLRDLLFIILGHYFASRRAARATATAAAATEPGPPPLYLPRGSIRVVVIAGFVAVGVLLERHGHLAPVGRSPASVTLLLVGGFLVGVVLAQVSAWLGRHGRRPPRYLEDAKALVALVAAVVLIVLVWNRYLPEISPPRPGFLGRPRLPIHQGVAEQSLAAVVGFYFGSRS